jgi:hypothetical protein
MGCVHKAGLKLGLLACLTVLAGCTGSSPDQVRDMGDGTYVVGVRSKALADQAHAVGEAVRTAGAYCHARGQKVQVVTNTGEPDVQFRCIGSADLPPAEAATQITPEKEETH